MKKLPRRIVAALILQITIFLALPREVHPASLQLKIGINDLYSFHEPDEATTSDAYGVCWHFVLDTTGSEFS